MAWWVARAMPLISATGEIESVPRHSRGFTLLELMVVIGFIAGTDRNHTLMWFTSVTTYPEGDK